MCLTPLIGSIVTQWRAHDPVSVNKTYSFFNRPQTFQGRRRDYKLPQLSRPPDCDTLSPWWREGAAQCPFRSLVSRGVPLSICVGSGLFLRKQRYNTLPPFTRMHLANEEKVELGLRELGTLNPAFGVRVIPTVAKSSYLLSWHRQKSIIFRGKQKCNAASLHYCTKS